MADYVSSLKNELVEQFKGKEKIEALVEVIGIELQQVFLFFQQLRDERSINEAIGAQLDGVGVISEMTRDDVSQYVSEFITGEDVDDNTYRRYIIWKILKNTCDCTYPDIIKSFRMFWDKPLYYSEDPEQPATMLFDTGELPGTVDTTPLFNTPLIRPAGVGLKINARTMTELESSRIYIKSSCGYTQSETVIPNL